MGSAFVAFLATVVALLCIRPPFVMCGRDGERHLAPQRVMLWALAVLTVLLTRDHWMRCF